MSTNSDSYLQAHYARFNDLSPAGFQATVALYRHMYGPLLPPDRGARIVELGCGPGQCLKFLEEDRYEDLTGVDLSREQLDAGRDRVRARLHCQDVMAFLGACTPASVDCVIANDLIEHIPQSQVPGFCAGIFGALRPGGIVIIKTPNMDCPLGLGSRYRDFTHVLGFTPDSLHTALTMAGFASLRFFDSAGCQPSARARVRMALNRALWRPIYRLSGLSCPKFLSNNIICCGSRPIG